MIKLQWIIYMEKDAIISLTPILQKTHLPKENPGGLKTYHEK